MRITPKSMGVLLVLVEHADKVVSRDELLTRVWPDTLPTNDVVTQAIAQLRRAFAQDPSNAKYIETIAKGGYRLLVAVIPPMASRIDAPILAPSLPYADMVDPSAGRVPRRHISRALALAALLLLAVAVWAQSQRAPGAVAASPQRPEPNMITSAPGFELAPTLSPDGSMVAYMAVPRGERGIAIMIQTTHPTAPRRLTQSTDLADDVRPQWSPDGREIAFLRVRHGRDCAILVVPAMGGVERRVGACDRHVLPSFDWTPDGSGLIFSSRGVNGSSAGLQILDLSRGAWSLLDYAASAKDVDFAPRYSPDGRWIVFVRNAPIGDFWRLPAGGGTAERLTRIGAEIRGWDWAPGGQALIYSRRHDSESRLFRFELATGQTQDMGVVDGEQPAVAASAAVLAYVHSRSYLGLHRFDLGAVEAGDTKGERLFASSGRDRLPSIAPDGRQLVFNSDRSGQFGLWWADMEQRSLRLLPGLRPESRHLASWSSDSLRVLVEGTGPDGRSGIFDVVPASGRMSRLPIPLPNPVQALFVPAGATTADDRLLVVAASGDGGRMGLTLFDRRVQPWRPMATIDRVSRAQTDALGQRVLFTRPGKAGLWQADLQLSPQSVRPLDGDQPVPSPGQPWAVAADGGLYTTRRRADCAALLRRSQTGGRPAQTLCLDSERRAATSDFSVDARTGQAYVALAEWDGGDIGLLRLDGAASEPKFK